VESETVLFWLFAALIVMVVVWFFLIRLLFSHLEAKHPDKYDEMGRPSLFSNSNFATNSATLRFLVRREHRELNDRYASMLSDVMLGISKCLFCLVHLSELIDQRANLIMRPNNSLQADKGKLSRHLPSHMARQLVFAAELSR